MQKLETILLLFFGSLLLLVVGGVLVAIYLWAAYSSLILVLSAIVFVVVMLAILGKSHVLEVGHKTMSSMLEDRRERHKQVLEIQATHKTQTRELDLHWRKQEDETRLREMELDLQRITVMSEAKVRMLECQRFAWEQAAGILPYQNTQTLYKPDDGTVIPLCREPGPLLGGGGPLLSPSQEDLPQAPVFREVVGLLKEGGIPLTWTVDGPRMGTLRDMLSMGLIGRPERGKTSALMYFTCLLLWMAAEVWVWDLHGELSALAGLHYFDRFEDIVASVPVLMRELDDRDALYRQTKSTTGIGQVKKPLVLIADEVPVLAAREKEQPRSVACSPMYTLRRFTLEARKWNGFVFLSGQSLPHTVLPTLTRDNLSSRIILECSPGHARQMGLDKRAIDSLLPLLRGAPRGTHIADFSTWSEPVLADIPYTDTADLRWVMEHRVGSWSPSREPEQSYQEAAAEPEDDQPATGQRPSTQLLSTWEPVALLPGAFHRTGRLQGDLLVVYQAIQHTGTTRNKTLVHVTGFSAGKVSQLYQVLKAHGYVP